MGTQNVRDQNGSVAFHEALLRDLAALDTMLAAGVFEDTPVRIGAEQEFVLIDPATGRAAPVAAAILERLHHPAFTTEMGKFNVEANLEPVEFAGDCLGVIERELAGLVHLLRDAARAAGAEPLLTGILPTLRLRDLTLANLTDQPRYHLLNQAVMRLRGGSYPVYLKGLDELQLVHDNVMLETCCTSFQVHLQVSPRRFAALYNAAQAAVAPVLAAAVNSPLLLGQRLWHETRIALFQHAVDERPHAQVARHHPTRVSFGEDWVRESVLEIFREQVARFRVILSGAPEEDSPALFAQGIIPQLSALKMHNGSVWRWNRPCYGVTNGRPHLRIEFRALPAGPTLLDEMANAAFLLGLVTALPTAYGDIAKRLPFASAKENFFAAARHGLKAQFDWLGDRSYSARDLILSELLPLASDGLRHAGVEGATRYLRVIRERVESGRTASQWTFDTLRAWGPTVPPERRDQALVAATLRRQPSGQPVHEWTVPSAAEFAPCPDTVASLMSTDLFTVAPSDPVSLAASVMEWRHVHHVPVEEEDSRFAGLVTSRHLLRQLAHPQPATSVREIMDRAPVTITAETRLCDAVALMRQHKVDCLPVLTGGRLAGLITIHDLLGIMGDLLPRQQGHVA